MAQTNVKSEWVDGNLIFRDKDGNIVDFKNGALGAQHGSVYNIRKRFTIAEVNAGATIVPAITGYGIRMVDGTATAVGGAVTSVTTVDILGTISTARKLAAFAQASLTQSTMLRVGASGAAILADGASFTKNDVSTAITVGVTGSAITVATHVDISFSFVVE